MYERLEEIILLNECGTVRSADNEMGDPASFRIDTRKKAIYFKASDSEEAEAWIKAIKDMVEPYEMQARENGKTLAQFCGFD
jgi:hypothetical protein